VADEVTKLILGDTGISPLEQPSSARRRFFRRRKTQRPPLTHCENCGAQLRGHWCAQCGQPAIDYRRSFRHVIADLLDEFLNWDSKFFATIGLLLVRPWKLTNQFLAGHRVRYVHPLRLYLLASILFFFAVNYWAKSIHLQPGKITSEDRAKIEAALDARNLTPEQRAKVEQALNMANMSPEVAAIMAAKSRDATPEGTATPQATPTSKETAPPLASSSPAFFPSGNPSTPFEKWIETHAKEKIGEHGTNLQLFVKTLISNLPYMVLCCIPLFALVLKILYMRRHIFYIDHLIYALHIHSFAYLATILIILATIGLSGVASGAFAGWIIALLWITFAAQILLSIRRVYRQGWFISIFKFLFGGFVYLIVLVAALAATFFVTLALP
jgi:ribosomal protein L32